MRFFARPRRSVVYRVGKLSSHMGDGQFRNAVLHGILQHPVVVEQFEQRLSRRSRRRCCRTSRISFHIPPHGSPRTRCGLFFIQVARRETIDTLFRRPPGNG